MTREEEIYKTMEEPVHQIPLYHWERLLERMPIKSTVVCQKCGLIDVIFYPYSYDKINNDVIYTSKCPKCGDIMFCSD